jgi:PAS domain S-box-containing protein
MLLWWGDDMIQFYNDAYRPSLGKDGKHPKALGQPAQECWTETWAVIYPLIQQVRKMGQSTWSEDQLMSIYRNGRIEDVYWTFGYSPVFNEYGKVEGVLVICTETTEKINTIKALQESEARFRTLADNIPNLAWMANADGWIFWYNNKWYEFTGTTPEQMEGWGWQSVHDPGYLPYVMEKWQHSIEKGYPFEMVFPLRGVDGTFRQFLTRVLPVYDQQGLVQKWFGTNTDITAQIQAEAAIKESEERFRTMAEGTDILIAMTDQEGHVTYINTPWIEFTGRSQEALIQEGWVDLVHPDDRDAYVNGYIKALEKREKYYGEARFLNKNGTYRWIFSQVTPRFQTNGTFAGYIGSNLDITERKNAERNAYESEQRLRSLVESAPFPIGVFIGADMRIELANQAILDVWYKGDEVIGEKFSELFPELATQRVFQQLEEVYSTGVPFHAKNQRIDLMVDSSLQSFYFNYSFTPLFNACGEVYGVMNTAADVTDLNLAKQKLEQSEANFRNMILQSPVAMCLMTGPNHVVEIANDSIIELWGKPRSAVMGKPIFEGLPDARNQGYEQLLDQVYTTGVAFRADEHPVVLLKNNITETVYQNFVYEPYRDGDGTVLGVLAITIDVTAQVLARQKIEEIVAERTQELAAINKDLQKSNAELAQFAYIASHDLQEPLRKIGTFTQMLENRLSDKMDEQSRVYLNKIYHSSSRMNNLIRDVLTYSELVKDNETFSPVDLNQIIEGILTDYELLIDQKKATIQCETLPTIEAIPLQMAQLFGNLISNALKFARIDLRPVISITYASFPIEENPLLDATLDYIKIQVADNGIGFKKEYAGQIFKIFQRLHRKSDYEGTGIGLAMCKKIALNHHGDINASQSSESGAVFDIMLPISQKASVLA